MQTRSRDCKGAGPAGAARGNPSKRSTNRTDDDAVRFKRSLRQSGGKASKGETHTTSRLDDDLLEWFRGQVQRAGGGSYQNPINDALREHIRRAVRKELRVVG